MRKRVFVKQRHIVIVGAQVALIVLSAAFAWLLRFEFTFPQARLFLLALPLLVSVRLLAMERFNLFHGYWRYTGMSDAVDIVKAVALGSAGFLIAERWIVGVTSFPISVYFIEAILTAGALGGVRMLSRAFMQSVQVHANGMASKTVVVIGAGCGAGMLLRELPRSGYTALALVDDDPAKAGVRLHGVRVAGTIKDLPRIVRHYGPEELMIAIPSATGEEMRRITERCQETGLRFRTIPGLADLIHGTVTVEQLREVNLEDLLGREPVEFNLRIGQAEDRGASGDGDRRGRFHRFGVMQPVTDVRAGETGLRGSGGDSALPSAAGPLAARGEGGLLRGRRYGRRPDARPDRGTRRARHLPRGGLQARFTYGRESPGSGEEQRIRLAHADGSRRPIGLRGLFAYILRQGCPSYQFHGLHQADRRADRRLPALGPDALRFACALGMCWVRRAA
jgi:hypothetical protein